MSRLIHLVNLTNSWSFNTVAYNHGTVFNAYLQWVVGGFVNLVFEGGDNNNQDKIEVNDAIGLGQEYAKYAQQVNGIFNSQRRRIVLCF